ncbi:hypothetical protein Lser_V15G11703 [Lactuca serriola]
MVLRYLKRFVIVMIIVSLLASMLRTGETRTLKEDHHRFDRYAGLLKSKLPRGPVPPSGPSLCHNSIDLYKQTEFVSTQEYQSYCP